MRNDPSRTSGPTDEPEPFIVALSADRPASDSRAAYRTVAARRAGPPQLLPELPPAAIYLSTTSAGPAAVCPGCRTAFVLLGSPVHITLSQTPSTRSSGTAVTVADVPAMRCGCGTTTVLGDTAERLQELVDQNTEGTDEAIEWQEALGRPSGRSS